MSQGNFVYISRPGYGEAKYIINKVENNNIYIYSEDHPNELSLLILDENNQWKVYGTDLQYSIRFESKVFPTNISELDIMILKTLDLRSLYNVCLANRYIAELCQKPEFWRRKVENIDPEILEYKKPEQSWKDYYLLVSKIPTNINDVIDYNSIDLLGWATANYPIDLDESNYEPAAENGNLDMLNAIEDMIIESDSEAIYHVSFDLEKIVKLPNAMEILQWLYANNLLFSGNTNLFFEAMKHNRLDIMQWMYSFYLNGGEAINVYDELEDWEEAIREVIQKDYLDVYLWLLENDLLTFEEEGFETLEEMYSEHANIAVQYNSRRFLDWLEGQGVFPKIGINDLATLRHFENLGATFGSGLADDAAKRGNYDVLEVLLTRNISPTEIGIYDAIENDHIDILDLLKRYDVEITSDEMDHAAEKNKIDVLNWGERNGILPTKVGANSAVREKSLEAINWMALRNIVPTSAGTNSAMENNDAYLVGWMVSLGVFPDQIHINWAARQNRLPLLRILGNYGKYPNVTGANEALEFRHFEVLDFLAERGIFPSKKNIHREFNRSREGVLPWLSKWNLTPKR